MRKFTVIIFFDLSFIVRTRMSGKFNFAKAGWFQKEIPRKNQIVEKWEDFIYFKKVETLRM